MIDLSFELTSSLNVKSSSRSLFDESIKLESFIQASNLKWFQIVKRTFPCGLSRWRASLAIAQSCFGGTPECLIDVLNGNVLQKNLQVVPGSGLSDPSQVEVRYVNLQPFQICTTGDNLRIPAF